MRRNRQCACDRRMTGFYDRCYKCRRPEPKFKVDHATGGLLSNTVPGHEERMARYTALAALELPLFPERR